MNVTEIEMLQKRARSLSKEAIDGMCTVPEFTKILKNREWNDDVVYYSSCEAFCGMLHKDLSTEEIENAKTVLQKISYDIKKDSDRWRRTVTVITALYNNTEIRSLSAWGIITTYQFLAKIEQITIHELTGLRIYGEILRVFKNEFVKGETEHYHHARAVVRNLSKDIRGNSSAWEKDIADLK